MSLADFMWSPASTPEAAGVDAQRLVEAVLGAEVGDRAVELRAACWRWNQWSAPLAMYAVEVGDDLVGTRP